MHPNIIPLYDAFLLPTTKELYFVFECMEGNLYQLTKSRKGRPLAGGLTASIIQQILLGLHHVQIHGFFHRDMKPENLLITTTGLADYPPTSHTMYPVLPSTPFQLEKDVVCTVKLADFGLARETASKPPYTEYVSTRWYRAPEVLLRSRDYSNPVDLWAFGTIVAEMVTLKPLFPGSSEIDQLLRICHLLGDPVRDYGRDSRGRQRGGGTWHAGVKLAQRVGFQWREVSAHLFFSYSWVDGKKLTESHLQTMPQRLSSIFNTEVVPMQLIDLIASTLLYDPAARITTTQCLQHPYLTEIAPRLQPVTDIPAYQQQLLQAAMRTEQHKQQQQQQRQSYVSPTASQTSFASYQSNQSTHSQASVASYTSEDAARAQAWRHPQHLARASSTSLNSNGHPAVVQHGQPPHWQNTPYMARQTTGSSSISYPDGSIFEGIAPQRDYVNTGAAGAAASSSSANNSGSTIFEDAYSVQLEMEERRQAREQQIRAQQQQEQQQAPLQQPTGKSKGWSLSSVFNAEHSKQSSSSLRRSSSQQSIGDAAGRVDPKQAKKAAKEAERAKREAASQAARERARAVMQNKSQLANRGQDIFRSGPNLVSMEASSMRPKLPPLSQQPSQSQRSFLTEDPARSLSSRWKSRRREEDDDVHSISSNETHHSRNSANEPRYSFSSFNTMDSDPLPKSGGPWSPPNPSLSRNPTGSSFDSTGRPGALDHFFQSYGGQMLPPKSSSSSVDSSLLQNFQGLSAADAQRLYSPFAGGPPGSAFDGQYPMASAPGPGTTFVPALHSLGSRQSSANSYHSMPTLPSQQQQSNLLSTSELREDDEMQTDN